MELPLPLESELEISVFGPGVGECVVVHLGYGDWMILDSCRGPVNRRPVALSYLESIGVDPAIAVKLVVATHFHDDHIGGLSDVVQSCVSARFLCSAALAREEFIELVEANRSLGIAAPGTGEFDAILNVLESRSPVGSSIVSPEWSMEGHRLYRRVSTPLSCEAYALSPSSTTMTLAHLRLAALLPTANVRKVPTRRINLNTLSLAMWVGFGKARAVLGGDLEEQGKPDEGWQAVIASPVRPQDAAAVFKVPHHGSPTAQHGAVWSELLTNEPIAVTTPYAKGGRKLPASADIQWLCRKTPNVYVTSLGLSKSPRSRTSVVDRALIRVAKARQAIGTDMGHVRVRVDATTGGWTVKTFGAAHPVCPTAA